LQRHLRDLVEQDGAAVGGAEEAFAPDEAPVKAPFW